MDWQKEATAADTPAPISGLASPHPVVPIPVAAWHHVARDASELAAIQSFHLDRLFHSLHYAANHAAQASRSSLPGDQTGSSAMEVDACCDRTPSAEAMISPVSFEFTVQVADSSAAVQQHLIHQSLHWVNYEPSGAQGAASETTTHLNMPLPVGFSLMTPTVTTATTAVIHPHATGMNADLAAIAHALQGTHNRAHSLLVAQIEAHANAFAQTHGSFASLANHPRQTTHSATQLRIQLPSTHAALRAYPAELLQRMQQEQEFLNEAFWTGPRGPEPATDAMLKQLPSRLIPKDSAAPPSTCTICQDSMQPGDTCSSIQCGHPYHRECLVQWLQLHNSCPLCRAAFQPLTSA